MIRLYKTERQNSQDILFRLIQIFDEYGKATPHEYAAILSTSHVHVEKALENDDVTGLMHLIAYHVEDGANTGDLITDGCVLHDVVTEITIREIMRNDALRESAHKIVMDMFVESTGRPLPMYALTTQPNGEQVFKPVPPKLSVVNQSKPIKAPEHHAD